MTCLRGGFTPGRAGCFANAHTNATKAVQGRANVKREDWRSVREWWRAIVVNNISDFFARGRAPNDPVVAVKWRFITSKGVGSALVTRRGHQDTSIRTYLKRSGKSHPANRKNLAFGDSSPGRPLKRTSCNFSSLSSVINVRD